MARPWWRRRRSRTSSNLVSTVSDFTIGGRNYSGVPVGESTALGISAFYRALSLIAGSVAQLPMRTLRIVDGEITQETRSVFDDPGGVVGMTPFEWKETVILHQLLHGDAFLAHVYNQAGDLAGLVPIHPLAVTLEQPHRDYGMVFARTYTATLADGSRYPFTSEDMTHCPALSVDGRRGLSLVSIARNSLGIAIAGDRAAARMFANGALISGLVTPEEGETVQPEDVKTIKSDLDATIGGWENAGGLALVNRRLKLSPWTMSNEDAQFLQSRQFQVEEIARWTGVPPHLLMQTEKQTSWGTGVAEQNRGLSRFTLAHWTTRLQEQLSRRLSVPRSVIFDYTEWEKPDPQQLTTMLVAQVKAGIITRNEARAALGMAPLPGGDQLESPTAQPEPAATGEMVPA